MVDWMEIGSAVGSIASLLGSKNSDSAKKSFEYSKALQQHQYELNRLTRQTSFQDTRYSLEQAGYNPMLAVNQQANGGTFGASLNVQDPRTENLNNYINKITAIANVASANSQQRLNSANSVLAEKQGDATVQDALNKTNQTSAQCELLKQQSESQKLDNDIKRQTGLNTAIANLENIRESTRNYKTNSMLNRVESNLKNAQIGNVRALTRQTEMQNSAIKAQSDWYRAHPKAAGYANWMNNVVGPTMSNILGGTQGYSNIRNASGNGKQFIKTTNINHYGN